MVQRIRLLLAAALASLLLAGTTAAAPAGAAMKRCAPVTGKPGGSATWRAHHIRLSQGFSCRRARRNVKTWIGFGGMMDHPRALAPWRCAFGARVRCRLRTSFGGTKPLRTYRMRFRIENL